MYPVNGKSPKFRGVRLSVDISIVKLNTMWQTKELTAPDRCYYLNQAYLPMFIAGLKRGKTNRSQTATDMEMLIT